MTKNLSISKKISLKDEINYFISWAYKNIKLWKRHLS